jgi:DNA invertase Pin-like site-specific DNA recombinase
MKTVCCLYRVSDKKQVDKDEETKKEDIPLQRKACRGFIDHMGWTLGREFEELGISGFKVSARKRDAIQELKDAALREEFQVLLVFMFDRLGRIDDETPFVLEWFVKHGIEVWSVNEGQQRFDSHVDKLTNYIRFWQASGESEKTSIRTKTRLGQLVEEGRFRGGGVPFGFRIEKQGRLNKRGHEVYELFIDEFEAGIVRMIFDLYANHGIGTQTVATMLAEQGIVNRSGNNFHPSTILNMLKNSTYLGIIRSGKSQSQPLPHLRIIDDETWERTQELIKQRSKAYEERRRVPKMIKGDCLLSGNIFCGHCGARLTLTTAGKAYSRINGTVVPHKYLRYVCYNRTRHKHLCDGQTGYAAKKVDACVETILMEMLDKLRGISNEALIERRFAGQVKELEARLSHAKKQLSKRVSELADLKTEVVKVIRGDSKWSAELLNEVIATTETEIAKLRTDARSLQFEHEQSGELYGRIKRQYASILNWSETFSESGMDVKKMIASQLIDRVTVSSGSRIEIDFNISFDQFLDEMTEDYEEALCGIKAVGQTV